VCVSLLPSHRWLLYPTRHEHLLNAVGDDETASADGGDPDIAIGTLRWILHSTKAKVREFIDHITKLMNGIFHSQGNDEKTDSFIDDVRSSFMLSVMVFIVVVVIRIQRS
ncbi:hypothetical protein B296_00020782, partial [Ensete ventricosum]